MSAIERLTVIGAGTMGHGIAQVAAIAGFDVVLNDVSRELVDTGLGAIRASLDKRVEKGKLTKEDRESALSRLTAQENLEPALANADLVVEAVPESLELKRQVFERADALSPGHAVLATNTSSLSVAGIAAATGRPGLVVGMHFFNPVAFMPLLEIVRAEGTAEATVQAALEVGSRLGKETIVVRDVPGFATSRLGIVIGLEAIRMLQQSVASAEDIDRAMTLGYRHPATCTPSCSPRRSALPNCWNAWSPRAS
jgi:3-hydroxybutyryl-CoA dehydrogenase